MITILPMLAFVCLTPSEDLEIAKHQGTWRVVSFMLDGVETPKEIANSIVRVVEGDHVTWKREGKSFAGTTMILDAGTDPKSIDVIADGGPLKDQKVPGIYKLDGETLTICMAGPNQPRPKDFQAEKGTRLTLMIFKRETNKVPK